MGVGELFEEGLHVADRLKKMAGYVVYRIFHIDGCLDVGTSDGVGAAHRLPADVRKLKHESAL